MVSFRNWTLALTGAALFAGLAGAQVVPQTPLQCTTGVSVTPALRAEGFTEQVGDVTLTCTGGTPLAPGTVIPQVNVQVFFNNAVTSRLLPQAAAANASEALLLIDEPGSGLTPVVPGFGPAAPQTVCGAAGTFASTAQSALGNPAVGCIAYANTNAHAAATAAAACTGTVSGSPAVCTATNDTPAANIYQGVVAGNSVTFFGIPVLPPGTTESARVFRITNIRVNANAFGTGPSGSNPVQASISISGATSLLISQASPTVGFVQAGLNQGNSTATSSSFQQCVTTTKAGVSLLSFAENFGTAFKTRVAAQSTGSYAGQVGNPGGNPPPGQNIPGMVYNSESNFVITVPQGPSGASTFAGLADYGTRLKATFTVPTGFTGTLWVSTTNVNNLGQAVTAPANPGGSAANNATNMQFAQLVSSETASDGNSGSVVGFVPAVSATDNAAGVPIAPVNVVNGVGTAVWEIVNTNPNQQETYKFGVYISYTANVAQNNPPAGGTIGVNLSFAPTTTTGTAASSSLTIPRFAPDSGAAKTIATFNVCQTTLLYPFVTNQIGLDTGIAISNTSADVFGTIQQSGTCTLSWFGSPSVNAFTTPVITAGTVYVNPTSAMAPGFQGYMIARCNFQYAHGLAFISDLGIREWASVYLPLVIPDPATTTGGRPANPLSLSSAGTGEQIAH